MMNKLFNNFCKLALLSLPFLAVSAVETNAVSLLNDSESFVVAKSEKLGYTKIGADKKVSKKVAGCSVDKDCRKGVCVNSKCVSCRPATGEGCKNSQKCSASYTCVDACQGVSCPAGKKVFDRTVAHACTCTACLVDTDCGAGKKCQTAASSANNACKNCADGEGCNCADGMVSNGAGGCKCAPISCPNDGTPCGTKTLTNGKCVCAEQSCDGTTTWSSKYCRCESPCPTGYVKDSSGNCTVCDVGYEKNIQGVCTKADSCEALGYVTAFSTEAGKECGDPETVASNEKGPTINGQSCYKCVYKTCAQMGTGLTDDAAQCNASRPYTVSSFSHAVLTEYKAGSGLYLPTRTGNTLLTASCVLCDSCTVYGQYCTACNSVDGCTECKQSGYSIDAQGNCTNKCTGYVENEVCVPCSPGSKFNKSCSPCAAGEVCGCAGGKVSDGKGACVSCLTQQPACCGKGGMVNGCYVCDECKTNHFLLVGGMCTLQTCKQYYGTFAKGSSPTQTFGTFNIGDSEAARCKSLGGHHIVPTKSAYPKADCSSLASSTECGTCEGCPAGQYAAKGDSDCSLCPAGYKCPTTFVVTPTACNNGTYQPNKGQTGCLTCPAGTYTPNDGKAYTACIPASCGHYVPTTGQNHETACEPGTYQPGTGKTSCITASCGQYVSGSGSCTVSTCPAGQYQTDTKKTSCVPASCGNYVAAAGACKQEACPAGQYQPSQGKTSCIAASCGNYVPTTGQCAQTQCAAGTYQPAQGKTSCIDASCGNYVASKGQCAQTQCAKGYYQKNTKQTACVAASIGYYVPSVGQCDQTAATCGHYVPTTAQSAVSTCAAGTYQPNVAQGTCIDASAGYFVATAGQCAQTACAKGYYQPNTKQTSCKAADCGNYVPTTGQNAQTKCPAGQYQTQTAQSACTPCPKGYYCATAGLCKGGSPCNDGGYQDQEGQTTCKPCPVGTWATTGTQAYTACTPAACGYYVPRMAQPGPSQCGQGYYSVGTGNASCTAASAGYYVSSATACSQTACPAGKCTDTSAQSSCRDCSTIPVSNGSCAECTSTCTCTKVTCANGYYVDGTSCKPCEAGYACKNGGRTHCHEGQYQDQTKQANCKDCPAGSYTLRSGQGSNGNTYCIKCPSGSYQSAAGRSYCDDCPSGKYCNTTGCSSCTSCSNLPTPGVHDSNPSAPFVRGDSCTACTATGTCTAVSCRTGTVMTSYADCQWCSSMFGNCATCTTSRCLTCPAGETVTSASSCTGNKYYLRTGELCGKCEECPSGKEPSSDRLSCVNSSCASKGYVTACQPGQGATYAGVTGSDGKCYTCRTCAAGTYSMGGTNDCQNCNSGYYSNAGSPKCYNCPKPVDNSGCYPYGPCMDPLGCDTCNAATGECSKANCPSGSVASGNLCYYCSYGYGTGCSTCSSSSCTTCGSGYVKSNGCPAGKVWQSAGYSYNGTPSVCGTCVDAGPTQTCAQINSNYKTSCPAGYGATSTGKTGTDGACYTCALCDESHYSAGGTGACSSCPSGTSTCGTGAKSSSQCLSTSTYQTYTGCPSGYTDVSSSKCGTLAGSQTHNVCTKNTCAQSCTNGDHSTCPRGYMCSNSCCVKCGIGSNMNTHCNCYGNEVSTGDGSCQGSKSGCYVRCADIFYCSSCKSVSSSTCGYSASQCETCKSGYTSDGNGGCKDSSSSSSSSGETCPPACGKTTGGCSFSACSWHGGGKCTQSHAVSNGGHWTCDSCSVGTRKKIGSNDFYSCCTYDC